MVLTILLLGIMFVCVGMLWNEGFWSNTITLINVVFAALIATNYFEPGAELLEKHVLEETFTYLCDFLAIWTIFFVVFTVLRAFTDTISKVRVRFRMPVEHVGRVVMAVWVGWVMVCFICMTLHLAPLARNSFGGAFAKTPDSACFLGMAPDRLWLGFVQSRSRGALSHGVSRGNSPYKIDAGKRVFDPESLFILRYGQRRADLEEHNAEHGTLRVRRPNNQPN